MRLDTIIVADAAAQAGGKLSILGAWTTRLRPRHFPWSEPLAIVVRAFIDEDDYGAAHVCHITIENEVGEGIGIPTHLEVSAEVLDAMREESLESEQGAVVFTGLHYGLQFREPGLYQVVVRFDGDEVGRYALPVVPANDT